MRVQLQVMALMAAAPAAAMAQGASGIGVPVRGLVAVEQAAAIRPVIGVAGASVLGAGVAVDGAQRLWLSPDQRYAIVERGATVSVGRIAQDGRLGGTALIAEAAAGADLAAFSPAGSAIALYSSHRQRMQVLAGLPDAPRVERDIDVSPGGGPVTSVAVTDDGRLVLASVAGETSAGVYVVGEQLHRISEAAGSLRFIPGTRAALLADRDNSRVLRIEEGADGFAATVVADQEQGVSSPADVAISADGRLAWLSNSGAGNLLSIDLSTGQTAALECGFVPARMANMGAREFLVRAADGEGVWVLESAREGPRVSYLPPAPEE